MALEKSREEEARLTSEARPWLDELTARNLSPGTVGHARKALLKLEKFLKARGTRAGYRDVQAADLEAWMDSMRRGGQLPATIDSAIGPVIRFYRWLERHSLIFENPVRNLSAPRYVRRMQPVPSETDMGRLLASIPLRSAINIRDRAILETAYAAGLRIGELRKLDLHSVDLDHGTVRTLGKGARERVVPLTKAAVAVIRLYLAESRPKLLRGRKNEPGLWLAFKGRRRIGAKALHKIIRDRAADAGLRMSMQSIRRAFATHLLNHGASPWDLKLFLGHATFRHLKHYLRYAPEELRKVHQRSRVGR